jgi:hypothetical protein
MVEHVDKAAGDVTAGTTAPENQYIRSLENRFIKDCAEVQKVLGIGYLIYFFVPLACTEI